MSTPSETWPIVDYSRYRVAEAIVERFRAGENPEDIADDFDIRLGPRDNDWIVELVVAAYDRRGMHRPTRGWR